MLLCLKQGGIQNFCHHYKKWRILLALYPPGIKELNLLCCREWLRYTMVHIIAYNEWYIWLWHRLWYIVIAICDLVPWWYHAMETLSTLLALCEGNPPVTGGFPSQRASNVDFWCLLNGTIYSIIKHFLFYSFIHFPILLNYQILQCIIKAVFTIFIFDDITELFECGYIIQHSSFFNKLLIFFLYKSPFPSHNWLKSLDIGWLVTHPVISVPKCHLPVCC